VFLMLRVAVRFGCLKRNSLEWEETRLSICPGKERPRVPGERLTWGGYSLVDWTNPISNLSFSSRCFRLLSFSQYNLPQTETQEILKQVSLPHSHQKAQGHRAQTAAFSAGTATDWIPPEWPWTLCSSKDRMGVLPVC
jgi:hypothetical protein